MATGVLPVFVGRATRAVEFCENAEKEYTAGLRLGIVTDTQDITGNTLKECAASITADELSAVLPRFMGAQKQIPPMYSAIKYGGKKLYELARRGVEVQRQARDITVSAINLVSSNGNDHVLQITCSKGTYIRTLCHDIGAALGCGGTMSSLRRTRAGTFTIDIALTLSEILDMICTGGLEKVAIPLDNIFSEYPDVKLSLVETRKCKNGAPLSIADLADGTYRFYGPDDEFLSLGEVVNCKIRTIKGFFTV